jgi:hypothetical protein
MTAESPIASAPGGSLPARLTWLRALMLSVGAIYLPQFVMCLYTLLFVSCDHCKKGVWLVAPLAPGGFIWEWARHFIGLPRVSGWVGVLVAACLTQLVIVGFAFLLRKSGRWRYPLLVLMLVASGGLAFVVLGVMRA